MNGGAMGRSKLKQTLRSALPCLPPSQSDPDFMCSELTALKYLFPGILRHPSTTTAATSFLPVLFRRNMKGASGKMCGLVVVGNNFQMRSEV